jgi:hypothetical protein
MEYTIGLYCQRSNLNAELVVLVILVVLVELVVLVVGGILVIEGIPSQAIE